MSKVSIEGNASGTGTLTIAAPNTNSNYTLTLPQATTTVVGTDATQTLTNKTLTSPTITGANMSSMASSVITSGTSQASTSGTSIDFTGIPSWVKRITVMFDSVSTIGTSNPLIQLGDSGGIENTGYVSRSWLSIPATSTSTSGFSVASGNSANVIRSVFVISLISGNTWILYGVGNLDGNAAALLASGTKTLSDTLTQVRITTVNGTDTFDAGSINILFE